jgi:hypothetical protein
MMNLLETMSRPFINDRLAERRKVKVRIAESTQTWAKIEAMVAAIAATEREIDLATHDHGEACAPIQTQLAEIQAKQVEAMVDKVQPDAALELRRLELLDELDVCNEQLSEACRRCNDKISRLNDEHAKLISMAGHTSPQSLRGELLKLGDPELLADLRYEQATSQNLASRIAMSESLLRQAQSELAKLRAIRKPDSDDKGRIALQESRQQRNALDLKRLGAALAHANERVAELTAEILAE